VGFQDRAAPTSSSARPRRSIGSVVEAQSPIHTVLTITLGGEPVVVTLEPKKIAKFEVPATACEASTTMTIC
jgi:hypothetical protein